MLGRNTSRSVAAPHRFGLLDDDSLGGDAQPRRRAPHAGTRAALDADSHAVAGFIRIGENRSGQRQGLPRRLRATAPTVPVVVTAADLMRDGSMPACGETDESPLGVGALAIVLQVDGRGALGIQEEAAEPFHPAGELVRIVGLTFAATRSGIVGLVGGKGGLAAVGTGRPAMASPRELQH